MFLHEGNSGTVFFLLRTAPAVQTAPCCFPESTPHGMSLGGYGHHVAGVALTACARAYPIHLTTGGDVDDKLRTRMYAVKEGTSQHVFK